MITRHRATGGYAISLGQNDPMPNVESRVGPPSEAMFDTNKDDEVDLMINRIKTVFEDDDNEPYDVNESATARILEISTGIIGLAEENSACGRGTIMYLRRLRSDLGWVDPDGRSTNSRSPDSGLPEHGPAGAGSTRHESVTDSDATTDRHSLPLELSIVRTFKVPGLGDLGALEIDVRIENKSTGVFYLPISVDPLSRSILPANTNRRIFNLFPLFRSEHDLKTLGRIRWDPSDSVPESFMN